MFLKKKEFEACLFGHQNKKKKLNFKKKKEKRSIKKKYTRTRTKKKLLELKGKV